MKSILLSIKPKYCELIANGKKTIEVRKTRPKLETPFKCYIYCSKKFFKKGDGYFQGKYCGKVIGEFVCDCVLSHCEMANADIAEQQGCIRRENLIEYANGKNIYGWHIDNPVIYDKPKELDEFYSACKNEAENDCSKCIDDRKQSCFEMTRPPQSWCYVEELE